MPEDRLAIRLATIRRQCEQAIREGRGLDPHRILATARGEKA